MAVVKRKGLPSLPSACLLTLGQHVRSGYLGLNRQRATTQPEPAWNLRATAGEGRKGGSNLNSQAHLPLQPSTHIISKSDNMFVE